jgi:hypothetical protein
MQSQQQLAQHTCTRSKVAGWGTESGLVAYQLESSHCAPRSSQSVCLGRAFVCIKLSMSTQIHACARAPVLLSGPMCYCLLNGVHHGLSAHAILPFNSSQRCTNLQQGATGMAADTGYLASQQGHCDSPQTSLRSSLEDAGHSGSYRSAKRLQKEACLVALNAHR